MFQNSIQDVLILFMRDRSWFTIKNGISALNIDGGQVMKKVGGGGLVVFNTEILLIIILLKQKMKTSW